MKHDKVKCSLVSPDNKENFNFSLTHGREKDHKITTPIKKDQPQFSLRTNPYNILVIFVK